MEQKQTWAFYPLGADKHYAGVITAVSPDADQNELATIYENLTFDKSDNGKLILVDRKLSSDKERFMAVTVRAGKAKWKSLRHTDVYPNIEERADNLHRKYEKVGLITS